MIQVFLFVLGASIGSFTNVLSLRYNPKKSLWTVIGGLSTKSRSHCPHCQKILAWYELIPIVSFVIQAGRCRSCKKSISLQYPVVEILVGGLAVGLWQFISPRGPIGHISFISTLSYLVSLLLLATLLTIALIDLRTTIIPDELILVSLGLTLLTFLTSLTDFRSVFSISRGFGLLIGGGFFTILWALGRGRWLGLGDAKLGASLGLWLGWPGIWLALAVAFISGTIVSVGLLLGHKKTLKDAIPFGPFLVLGAIVAFFWLGWFEGWWWMLWIT